MAASNDTKNSQSKPKILIDKINDATESISKGLRWTCCSLGKNYQSVASSNASPLEQILSTKVKTNMNTLGISFKEDDYGTETSVGSNDEQKQIQAYKFLLRILHGYVHGKDGLLAHAGCAALGGAWTAALITAIYARISSSVNKLAAYTLPKLMQLIHQQPTVAALAVSVAVVIGLVSLICATVTATVKVSNASIAEYQLNRLANDQSSPTYAN